MNNALA
jgi:hypothetical protein